MRSPENVLSAEQAKLLWVIGWEVGSCFDQNTGNMTALSHAMQLPTSEIYAMLVYWRCGGGGWWSFQRRGCRSMSGFLGLRDSARSPSAYTAAPHPHTALAMLQFQPAEAKSRRVRVRRVFPLQRPMSRRLPRWHSADRGNSSAAASGIAMPRCLQRQPLIAGGGRNFPPDWR